MKTNTTTSRTFRGLPVIALAIAALGLSQPAVRAAIITSDDTVTLSANGGQDDASVVGQWITAKGSAPVDTANDLFKNHATVSMSAPKLGLGDSLSAINDGLLLSGGHTSGQTDGLCLFTSTGNWMGSGPVDVVFTLDAAYNIGRIDGFTLWDLSRLGQKYDLYASTDSGASWNLVTSVSKDATGSDGNRYIRRISLTDSGGVITGLAGVNALKFHIMDPGPGGATNNNSIYAEIAAYAAAPSLADAATSTVTASPTTVASDGVTTSTITVTLNDASNAPVPGKTVSLAQMSGPGTAMIATVSGTTNGSGIATFTVKCDTAGDYEFEATDTTDTVTVTQKAGVTFSASAVSLANSTVDAFPTTVLADGADTSTITVTLKDATNSAVVGNTVSLAMTSGPGSPTIETISGTTDSSGIATFTVKSATVGVCVFTATDVTDSLVLTATATVDFTPVGVVEDANSTVVASPAIVPADGTTASTITVTLKDPYGNPVPDKTVSLATTSGSVIDPASATTDASGVATFTVTSTTAGDYVFTATGGSVTLTQTPAVTFGPSPSASTVTASPSPLSADGTTSTITVTLLDGAANPVAGKDVSLASSRGTPPDTISPTSGVSDASGVVTFTVSSTTAGSPVFTATDTTDGITIGTAGVTFVAGPVVAGNSTVIASPTTVVADDVATSTITVTLNDANNNPVAGKDVSLASSSGTPPDTISPPTSGVSNDSGVVTFTVSSSTPGTSVFTATDTTDGNMEINPSTATVTFTQPPAIIVWGSATDDTLNGDNTAFLETDVKINGEFVAAVTNGNSGTVNTVPFQGCTNYSGAGGLFTYGSSPITLQWSPENGENRNANWGGPGEKYGSFGYKHETSTNLLLTGGGDGVKPGTITLSSLIAGRTYQVQIWAPTWNNTFNLSVGGVNLRVGNPPGTLSQYVVGTFTANGTSQTISWSGIAPSAISLRDLSPLAQMITFGLPGSPAVISQVGAVGTIEWTAPLGTTPEQVELLMPEFTLSDEATCDRVTGTALGSPPYIYTVTNIAAVPDTVVYTLTVTLLSPPPNDNFANAIDLPGDTGTHTGTDNNYATLEAGEPNPGASNTVWFKWTAAADGKLAVSTLGSTNPTAGEWDAVLGIYTGTTLADLSIALDLYCPANDYDNIPGFYGNPQDTGSYETTQFSVTAGTTYYIQLAGYTNAVAANILLSWSFAASAGSMTPIDLRSVATTAVTASSSYTDYLPEYVSDWSGMSGIFPDGLDGTGDWQWSSDGNQDPSQDWIAWDLGASYTLGKVHVWNDNAYANGIKTVDIEVSSDGITWTPTAYTGLSWPDAPGGTAVYAGFDQVFSTPITTRYIRFANLVSYGGWVGGGNYVGLDEVVFYATATPPSDSFTSWITGLDWTGFVSPDLTPTGDPDNDGLNNQQEYAFGLDPTSGSSVNPISQQLYKASGTFKYTRRKTSGLTYIYQWSTTLSDPWNDFTPVTNPPDAASISDTVEEVTIVVPAALINDNSTKLFVRVCAE